MLWRSLPRPDGSADVIDYKFTAEPSDAHRRQVAQYLDMMRDMGHTRVCGYLWYPELRIKGFGEQGAGGPAHGVAGACGVAHLCEGVVEVVEGAHAREDVGEVVAAST